jgi:hypothetical protein
MQQQPLQIDQELIHLDNHRFAKFLACWPRYTPQFEVKPGLKIEIVDRYLKLWGKPDPGFQPTFEVCIVQEDPLVYLEGCILLLTVEGWNQVRIAQPSGWGPQHTLLIPQSTWLDILSVAQVTLITRRSPHD